MSSPLTLTRRKIYVVYSEWTVYGAYTSKEAADKKEHEITEEHRNEIRDPDSRPCVNVDETDLEDWIENGKD